MRRCVLPGDTKSRSRSVPHPTLPTSLPAPVLQVDRTLCAWLVNTFRAEVNPSALPQPAWPPQPEARAAGAQVPPAKGAAPPALPPDRISPMLVSDALDQRQRSAAASDPRAYSAVTDDDPLFDCPAGTGMVVDDDETVMSASGVSRASSTLSSSTTSAPGDME